MIGAYEELCQIVEQAPSPTPAVSPERQALLEALAKAIVLRHEQPWLCVDTVQPFWRGPQPLPTARRMRNLARQAKALIPHIKGLDQVLSPWTPGFWHGLTLAGALVVHGGYPRLQPDRPWLEEDLERVPFPCKLSPPDRQGRRWLSCQACRLPVTNTLGADVLAGLLAGSRRAIAGDGTWLVVPQTEAVGRLLDWWGVSTTKATKPDELRISPFYGLLLSRHMPPASAASMQVRQAGGCPILPLAIWESTFGPGKPPNYMLPSKAGALPYACCDKTRKRRGWTRDFLHTKAVEFGVAQASPEMRQLLKDWRATHP